MGIFSDVLLTVDFDRTLTGPDLSIPEVNLRAIRFFMENGGAFTVNTGRSLPMAERILAQVPVNAPVLLYNGALAYDPGEKQVIFSTPIPLDQGAVIRRCLELFPGMTVEIQGIAAHYCFREDRAWNEFNDFNHCPWAMVSPEEDLGPFLKYTIYGPIRSPKGSGLFEATPEEEAMVTRAQTVLEREFGESIVAARSAAKLLDVQARGTGKGLAARRLQKDLGRKLLVCVGDAENDLDMMDRADHAFAPADGAIADRYPKVCPCGQGAVAQVIFEKIPEILKITLDKGENLW